MEGFTISLLKNIPHTKGGADREVVFELEAKEEQREEEVIRDFAHHVRSFCHPFQYEGGTVYISCWGQYHINFPTELIEVLHIMKWKLELSGND